MPCAILMDLNTPRMAGKEFLKIIATENLLNNIPVVAMSTSNESKEVDEILRLGAYRYIVKPVDYAEFVEALRGVEQLWRSTELTAAAPSRTASAPTMPY